MTEPTRDTPAPRSAAAPAERPLPELLGELWDLIKAYVRQETVDPLKSVGRFVAFGVAGAFCIGIGVVFLAIGCLRVLQSETDTTFTGNLTWVPYGIIFAALLVGGALSLAAIGRRASKRGAPR